ncbi:serine/threonine-protein kinase AFC3-like isoform X2 [Silene latifolia]|uniref:serine/threonine-protein kinase AFC3-like isoform X2 n=1 Tax=Silene latifolia TaxID=37657 RepID=UPI003D773FE8
MIIHLESLTQVQEGISIFNTNSHRPEMTTANMTSLDVDSRQPRKRRRIVWDVAPDGFIQGNIPHFTNNVLERYVSPPKRDDDPEGHYVFSVGENLTSRYKILSKMGEGTFGQVLECLDRQTQESVAIKVVRSNSRYRGGAMIEIDILRHLAEHDKVDSHCVQIRSWFDYRNHICIVFEKLGPSLYDILKRNRYRPFHVDLVRDFGRQLLESVAYMHELHLIHTDLKPENILLVSSECVRLPFSEISAKETRYSYLPNSSAIKLIDFGSAVYDNPSHSSTVSTRHYRAPEVILGLGWSYPCDLWGVGCILVELCSGRALFQTHENLEHLAMMEKVLGPFPRHMIQKATRGAEKYFRRGSRLNWPEGAESRESCRAVQKLEHVKDLISRHVDRSKSSLIDLLCKLLRFDPTERPTAKEALNHPFFKENTSRS